MDSKNREEISVLLSALILQQKKEQQALAGQTSETLSTLNISIEALPLKCQQLLNQVSELQTRTESQNIDPISTRAKHSNIINSELELEYNVLELKQKNTKLRKEVERNKKFIQGLRKELSETKQSLIKHNPNPDNIQEHLRETKLKLASYEEVYEKAKAKYSKLNIPEELLPASLRSLSEQLEAKLSEEAELKERADDITLARRARDMLREMSSNK